ncbi:uncharacterized protein LOC126657052 [Mercurialis annua]|uniref:uncharacterized protein LOC126657052 n=1 Tax=Mercurialis annua TaxID=3986 RepID=UPI00215F8D67|nr:uncharacterized protein LOC126657052 [Mercurialis annua]
MNEAEQEKTAFTTDSGTYCYNVMPFGLKNAGATYQRLVNFMFKDQLGRNIEVYVDDLIIKSSTPEEHAKDLEETFAVLNKFNMKLNPEKCAFGIKAGKFLGYLVSQRGIEANPEKIQAILDMVAPRSIREVQKLNGRVTALGRFVSSSAKRCLPFFKQLRNMKKFEWNDECKKAFEELKVFLTSPPLLSRPKAGEILYLYLSAGKETIASVLVREEEEEQLPIYYSSRTLKGAELNYPTIDKLALMVVVAAKKLRPYFQGHTVIIRTNQPLRKALQRPETSGRMVSWSIQLGEHDIRYEPRKTLKAQALADFVVEMTEKPDTEEPREAVTWNLYVDGASNDLGAGAGVVLEGPMGITIEYAVHLTFKATNNMAEYEALITGLSIAKAMKTEVLRVHSDSQFTGQIGGQFQAKEAKMAKYMEKAKELLNDIERFGGEWEIYPIPREENAAADAIAKAAAAKNQRFMEMKMTEERSTSSVDKEEEVLPIEEVDTWMQRLLAYLTEGILPEQTAEAAKEIHEGICGAHEASAALVRKASLQGFYWLSMKKDAEDLVLKCDKCQKFGAVIRTPASEQHPIGSPWPFMTWGVDILGPFPPARGQVKFIVVAVDHFTKWVEVEPMKTITTEKIQTWLSREVMGRFGIPHSLVTDNGKQFDCRKFRAYCEGLNIKLKFTSVAHPQTNGLTEVTNRTILTGIKKRLDDLKGRWIDELYKVIWAYRTTPRKATGETPFSLVYGTEAVLPVEIGMPSLRVQVFDEEKNEESMRLCLDLLEERRHQTAVKAEAYRRQMARYHNAKVKGKSFMVGDLILRKAEIGKGAAGVGKLGANWDGPFRVVEVVGKGAYRIARLEGQILPRTWNINDMKKYFQ